MPTTSASEQFDEFYIATRRRLLLQAFALTGDLGAARAGVREAYVAAGHHWRKVSRLEQPEDWVRPRAWTAAQRRGVGRPFHREKDLDDRQQAVLAALQRLPDLQRRALLLTHLAALSLPEIGREIGQPVERTTELLQQASASLSVSLECDSALLRAQIESLAPLVARPGLPRSSIVQRAGRRRRRRHTLAGAGLAVALVLAGGFFVVDRSPAPASARQVSDPVTAAMLVGPRQAAAIAPHSRWKVRRTDHNTDGDGLHSVCQQSRFADPRALAAFVRTLDSTGKVRRHLVEALEVSRSPEMARKTYATTVGWYAGCVGAQVHLVDAFRVSGVGDRATLLRLRLPGDRPRSAVVAVVNKSQLTQSLVLQVPQAAPPRPGVLLPTLASGLRQLCASSVVGSCPKPRPRPRLHPSLPPSGDARGMLATVDLPEIRGVDAAWVGTSPKKGGPNLARTNCDKADFSAAGARMRTRSFLMPQASLPERFGITESYGTFPTAAKAGGFVEQVRKRLARCEHDQLGTHLSHHVDVRKGKRGSTYSLWRVTAEISEQRSVSYWMGVARVGRYVAQVNFATAPKADIDQPTFTRLVERARDRLFELSRK